MTKTCGKRKLGYDPDFTVPYKVDDGRTFAQVLMDLVIDKPGLTVNELKWLLVDKGIWPEHVGVDCGLASRLRSLVVSGRLGRGKKRLDTAPPFSNNVRRVACFTYWPMYLMSNGDPNDPTSIFTGEFRKVMETVSNLMDRPSTQVPMTELLRHIKWLHKQVKQSEVVSSYRTYKPVVHLKGGKA